MALQLVDRSISLPRDAESLLRRLEGGHDQWLMTDAERGTLEALLAEVKPQCAIEVGVYRAGSLARLAAHSEKVYALDVDPFCHATYGAQFPNVEFVTGPSSQTLPLVVERLQQADEHLDFVLIDADHSGPGVRRDIDDILAYRPRRRPTYVIIHDSFNPDCRDGMRRAAWSGNPHAHLLELDFVLGRFVTEEEGDGCGQMWCGFALAILLPEQRRGEFIVRENESLAYRTALRHSVYRYQKWWNPAHSLPPLAARVRRRTTRWLHEHGARPTGAR